MPHRARRRKVGFVAAAAAAAAAAAQLVLVEADERRKMEEMGKGKSEGGESNSIWRPTLQSTTSIH